MKEPNVKDEYEDGVCPDCQQPIPTDAVHGESCSNCGHVWNPIDPKVADPSVVG